jgi:hypothetical protein
MYDAFLYDGPTQSTGVLRNRAAWMFSPLASTLIQGSEYGVREHPADDVRQVVLSAWR